MGVTFSRTLLYREKRHKTICWGNSAISSTLEFKGKIGRDSGVQLFISIKRKTTVVRPNLSGI